ncbi:hypothetical protein K493DRAFT_404927 [Basidiobolus meristosporus CBS 931.73]|uniref:Uncharacterized protein n=1 Tax=Basidiobolus meristosporus CBS 931.73 TaxID=1314790 RepID=A0A1Y1YZZ8_9FUNG|nr:hypothetical protein K493DRAFT_404927 [Basidiobolus meristosporus CBS 931.73]|eukprot:ORY03612.1 hypothetical protein K493DRAFT_404927 [Basidiobolus meristosporus CBS 931.73]
MFSKIKHISAAFISLLLLLNASAMVMKDVLDDPELNVQVESLQVAPESKILAISINQVDKIISESGELLNRPRVLTMNLNLDERQIIEDGIQIYENVPVFASDIQEAGDMLEAELMNIAPKMLPVKMYGWADVEYDEEQDIFFPRVVLQTQILDKNTVGKKVVQVIIDLPETGEILIFPPQKISLDEAYYFPQEEQERVPFWDFEDNRSHEHHHKCNHKHGSHKHMKHALKQAKSYLHNVVEDSQRAKREALMDLEVREALLQDEEEIRDEKILSHNYYPVKIDEAFSTGEEKGLLDDHE